MRLKYKQTKKSNLWNQNNKVKTPHWVHTSRYVNIPKEWARELGFEKFMLMTLDLANQQIILKKLPSDEDFELPEKGEGWVDEN